jgi:mono/diheme cytochrome c family protein
MSLKQVFSVDLGMLFEVLRTQFIINSKNRKMKKSIFTLMVLGIAVIAYAGDKKPWNAPDKDAKMSSAVKSSAESIAAGKVLFAKHCESCHGKTGLGDGKKAATLETDPGDMSKAAFQGQSDGSLFYKINEGRDDMPSFKKKITEANDVWNVVTYLRTFKK